MTDVYNTLPFDPEFKSNDYDYDLVDSLVRGQVLIEDNRVIKGQDVIVAIESNPSKIFLVSKPVFDYCQNNYMYNVCMFNPKLTEYDQNGKAVCQRGLLF